MSALIYNVFQFSGGFYMNFVLCCVVFIMEKAAATVSVDVIEMLTQHYRQVELLLFLQQHGDTIEKNYEKISIAEN